MALGDTLVSFLLLHYSDEEVTHLFLLDPYPTPLPPVHAPDNLPRSEPLFLPDRDTTEPLPAEPIAGPSQPRARSMALVILPPDPPAADSLTAELAIDTAYHSPSREKERKRQQLNDIIKHHTDPSSRGRHASSKEKCSDPTLFSMLSFLSSSSTGFTDAPLFISPAIDTSRLQKTSNGLAIWPPLTLAAAAARQVWNKVSFCC